MDGSWSPAEAHASGGIARDRRSRVRMRRGLNKLLADACTGGSTSRPPSKQPLAQGVAMPQAAYVPPLGAYGRKPQPLGSSCQRRERTGPPPWVVMQRSSRCFTAIGIDGRLVLRYSMHRLLSGLSLLGCGMVHDSTGPLDVSQHQQLTVGPGETLLYNGHALHLSVVRKGGLSERSKKHGEGEGLRAC